MLKRPMKPFFGRAVLNDTAAPAGPGPAAAAESLQRAVLGAIAAHTQVDGRLDYATLPAPSEWSEAVARAGALQAVAVDGQGCVTCARILEWHAEDFEAARGLGVFLARYLDAGPARDAVAGRARPCDAYRPYDRALQHEPAE
jgi:hypothetical protein